MENKPVKIDDYEARKAKERREEVINDVVGSTFAILVFLMGGLLLLSLGIIVWGFFDGTGHASIWTTLAWVSLITGLLSYIIVEFFVE